MQRDNIHLEDIREDFLSLPEAERLTLLLEFSNSLPELPEHYAEHQELLEPVPECQSPLKMFVELVSEEGVDVENGDGLRVQLYATAPREAPTTRGFAAVMVLGTAGFTPEQVAAIPAEFPLSLGLTKLVSPLRLHGMTALIARMKAATARQLRCQPSSQTK